MLTVTLFFRLPCTVNVEQENAGGVTTAEHETDVGVLDQVVPLQA